MRTMVAAILRGLRSRALLSSGSVMLTALAVGSAVLGPIFAVAVTNSYLVTRLDDAPNYLTGLSWRFTPDSSSGRPEEAVRRAVAVTAREPGPFVAAQTFLESEPVPALGGFAKLYATPDSCAHLEIEGSCPGAGEVLLLAGDAEFTTTAVGEVVSVGSLGSFEVVGTYRVPVTGEEDFWFDLQRFASVPARETQAGFTPYFPAPLVTAVESFDSLDGRSWSVLVDRRLDVPPDLTVADLDLARRTAGTLGDPGRVVAGGQLEGESINDLPSLATEIRDQQTTARNSIAPAVISLVLVALALLLRLLMAAADLRMPEIALASLRGLSRRKMWSLGLSEPLALLALSAPVGALVGFALSLGLVRWWLVPGLPLPLTWQALAAGGLVMFAAVGVAVLAVGLVLRVTLAEQLSGVRRPQRGGGNRASMVARLVLVALAAAILASKLTGAGPGDPDATDLVLPVLLAVVAGLGASSVTAAAATWWTRRGRRSGSLPGFVATRAISRRREGTLVILPVTAAIAICVFGAGVYDSAAQWRASVAATVAPAPVVWTSPLTMERTIELTNRLDPDRQWLMAASTLTTTGPTYAVLDTSRLARVATWPDQWTPGVSTEQIAEALRLDAAVPVFSGTTVGLTVENDLTASDDLRVQLRVDPGEGRVRDVFLGPFADGRSSAETSVPFCRVGCEIEELTLGGGAASPMTMVGAVRISDFTADGDPVPGATEGAGWDVSPLASAAESIESVTVRNETIEVEVDAAGEAIIVQLTAGGVPIALPVVRGEDADPRGDPGAVSTQAFDFEVSDFDVARSVPLVGPIGLMIDYDTLSTGRNLLEQGSQVYVLARADTPASVRQGLQDRGASVETTLADVRRTLDQSAYALTLRLYAVVAAMVLLMALAGLFVSTAVQLPARRRDAAALRVVGVPRRSVVAAVVGEFAVVLGSTAVAGLAAGALAQYVVLRNVTLGYVEDLATPALIAAVDPGRLTVLAAVIAVLFGAVAIGSAALTVRGARGATLRETAR